MQQINRAMSATEIIEQIKGLPKNELAHVIEYVHQLERHAGLAAPEMTDTELLAAANRTGTFRLLDAPGEDIYSTDKQ